MFKYSPDGKGSVSGYVYDDANTNATRNAGEGTLSGVTVYVDANDDGILDPDEASALSDANGFYTFTLPAGTYHLRVILPDGMGQTDPAISGSKAVTFTAGELANANIGLHVNTAPTGAISGTPTASVGSSPMTLRVLWSDVDGIDTATFGSDDITVTLPDGTTASATFVSFTGTPAATIATYHVLPPSYGWDFTLSGSFEVVALVGGVGDRLGMSSGTTASIGTFSKTFALPANGPLSYTGTAGTDSVSLTVSGSVLSLIVDSVITKHYRVSGVTSVSINTLGGDDTITIGPGVRACTIDGGMGNDSITAGDGADSIRGDAGNDTILGGAGNDTIMGNTEDDSITGGDGADSIMAGLGADTVDGGIAGDTLLAGDGRDLILGGDGSDWIEGRGKMDTIYGGIGNDTIWGGADPTASTVRPAMIGLMSGWPPSSTTASTAVTAPTRIVPIAMMCWIVWRR